MQPDDQIGNGTHQRLESCRFCGQRGIFDDKFVNSGL